MKKKQYIDFVMKEVNLMTINPVLFGVIATIDVELVIALIIIIYYAVKQTKNNRK